jgi:hypothetical protein
MFELRTKLMLIARKMRLARPDCAAQIDYAFNTLDEIFFIGIDDKSAANIPDVPLAHTSELAKFIISLNGQADYVDQTMSAYVACFRSPHPPLSFVSSHRSVTGLRIVRRSVSVDG